MITQLSPYECFIDNPQLFFRASSRIFIVGVKVMTDLLRQAFNEAEKLPDEEQQEFAAMMLEEIRSKRRWKDAFEGSTDELELLAEEAKKEFDRGDTEELNPGNL
jgi:hypothetical protein